jgi:hypothetical protein
MDSELDIVAPPAAMRITNTSESGAEPVTVSSPGGGTPPNADDLDDLLPEPSTEPPAPRRPKDAGEVRWTRVPAPDLVGHVFGRLTVLERTAPTSGSRRWRCGCACGQERNVTTTDLRRGRVKSCGCLRVERLRERARKVLLSWSLVGEVFGRLTVVERVDHAGRTEWCCRCICDREIVVRTHLLRAGIKQSCGCLPPAKAPALVGGVFALVGAVFGRLTVLAAATDVASRKRVWRCRCDCGQETTVPTDSLRRGVTRSCGCLRTERARETLIARRQPAAMRERA